MQAELKEKALMLPHSSGVYIMRDKNNGIIYIGKAKSLKNRVSQYFANLAAHSEKTRQMISHIDHFDVMLTKTEFDALLLEAQLIKKNKPKYNILLKDDKGYPFVKLGSGEYPRFSIEGKKDDKKARYFGPYSGRSQARNAIDTALDVMKLPTCTRVFPRDFGRARPCLNLHLGKCIGFCTGLIEDGEYTRRIDQACEILDGKHAGLIAKTQREMSVASEREEYEKAAQLRDRIIVLDKIKTGQGIFSKKFIDTDVLGYASLNMRGAICKMSIAHGTLLEKEVLFFDGADATDGAEILESFIKQYYSGTECPPNSVVVSEKIADELNIEEYLSQISDKRVHLVFPQKGEKRANADLAVENALAELLMAQKAQQKTMKSLEMLGDILKIAPPERIESYDISNMSGSDAVGSMVVFEHGKPLKKAYKRFKIQEARGGDDYGSMSEVLSRRLDRLVAGEPSWLPQPNLMLIDGGMGQVGVANEQLQKRALTIPVYGMVKDDRHRTRALVDVNGDTIGIDNLPAVFGFITRVQDETHRFAIEYHKLLRGNKLKVSVLDNISGIGQRRKALLFKHFKTIDAIKHASVEELSQVVSANVAQEIKTYFENEGKTI